MGAQANLEVVQRGYQAFAEGDLATVNTLLTDDIEWTYHPTHTGIPWAVRTWKGRDAVLQSLKILGDLVEFLEFQADEFIVGDGSVVALGHERCRVRATGRIIEAKWAQIFTLRDGKISRYREYSDNSAWDRGFSGGAATVNRA